MSTSKVLLSEVHPRPASAGPRRGPVCLVPLAPSRLAEPWVLDRDSPNVIGRDSRYSNLVLDDPNVSRRHADIRYEHGRFTLYDLQSTAGTFVNHRRIFRWHLRPFDLIRLGNTHLVFAPAENPPSLLHLHPQRRR